jgi:hypothetical protein
LRNWNGGTTLTVALTGRVGNLPTYPFSSSVIRTGPTAPFSLAR